jgi:hypothetical protein
MVGVSWPDRVDEIIGGDLTAALAYVTPAGGAVVTGVAPIGLRDREAGTVSFTTSLGFGRKLDRIKRNPSVALAYHSREHGFAAGPELVLVQGDATAETEPDRRLLEDVISPQAERFLGPPKRGRLFWDRWLQEYYADRVPVAVAVKRIVAWPDELAAGVPEAFGAPLPALPPEPQAPPSGGTASRLDSKRAAQRLLDLPNRLLSFVGADGYPEIVPIEIEGGDASGIRLRAERALPPGGRRAGLLAHAYRAKLIGLAARGHTGWISVDGDSHHATYAPHTEFGFRAPANKTLLLLANGLLAKRGLRRARREAASA